jgi:hypothetical protein
VSKTAYVRLVLLSVVLWYAWQLTSTAVPYLLGGTEQFALPFRPKYIRLLPWVLSHGLCACCALAIGPLLLLRPYFPLLGRYHSLLGKSYLAAAIIGGLAALPLSVQAEGGPMAQAGFLALNALWLWGAKGVWQSAKSRQWQLHQAWVNFHFGLTFSAVLSRLAMNVSGLLEIDFNQSYTAIAWLSWMPGLMIGLYGIGGRYLSQQPATSHPSAS